MDVLINVELFKKEVGWDSGLGLSNGSIGDVGSKEVGFKEVGNQESNPDAGPKAKALVNVMP